MKTLVDIAVRNPVFVNILLVMVLLSGIYAQSKLTREVLPEFSLDIIRVEVPYPGAGPDEVEEGICLKIEEAVKGIEGIKRYTTVAAENVGSGVIEVRENADTQEVKDEITNAINAIPTFPVDAERPIISEMTLRGQVLLIAVYGDLPEEQLKELAQEIKDELVQRPSISQVSLTGVRPYEISIEISEEKLREYGLTFDQVSAAVRQASQNWPGGTIRTPNEQIKVRTVNRRYTGDDYARIVLLAREDGTQIMLRDVAAIQDGFVEDDLFSRFNGERGVQINVFKTNEEDALRISDEVNEYVAEKLKSLPPSVHLQVWADGSNMIRDRLRILIENGRLGLILVFLLLWAFLDLRLAFWCSMGIPIALAGAVALMGVQGQTINMITMFALIMILGIIVDDAIIVGESIYVKRKQGLGPVESAREGAKAVAWPVFAAVITTIIAFLPLMFITGIMGKFIRVMPMVVIAALLTSLLESLFMLPAHLRHLPDFSKAARARGVFGIVTRARYQFGEGVEWFIHRIYQPFIRTVLEWRFVTFAVAFMILMVSIGLARSDYLKFVMMPETDSDYFTVKVEYPNGTPLDVTMAGVRQIEAGIRKIDEEMKTASGDPLILSVFAVTGGQSGFVMAEGSSNQGEIYVELLPTEERNIFYKEIMTRLEEVVGPLPGALSVLYEIPDQGPGGKPIEFWLLGESLDELKAASEKLKSRLSQFEGVFQISDDFRPGKRELRAILKPEARNLGITEADLGRQLRQGFYGDEALRIQRGRDDVRIWIRYPEADRNSLASIESMRIRTADGREIPLISVADVDIVPGYSTINRKDGLRRVIVSAEVDDTRANSSQIMRELVEHDVPRLEAEFSGISFETEGQRRESADSFGSLAISFPLALLGIFLVLATMFRSYFQPLVIMITIPFGLIGAIAGHMVMGIDISMMSMFGMVALSGIVVNDAIVLIECYNENLAAGMHVKHALVTAGMRRFRAILLTTLTTSFGLAPMIFERSMQAQFLIPMAVAIAFGVAFASLLTLILIPCLLYILNDLQRAFIWLWKGRLPGRDDVEPMAPHEVEG